MLMSKRVETILIGSVIFSLFLLALYRSIQLDMTNDEAYSFKLVHDLTQHFSSARNQMIGSANTHWLNSFFLWIEVHLIGTEPWMLRLHSVLAVGLFLYALFHVFKQEKNIFIFIPFLLLACNHYLFDFFSLARGYALEMAFEMMAFYSIFSSKKASVIYNWLLLSCLANYTNLYVLIAFFIVDFLQEGQKNGKMIYIMFGFLRSRWMLFPFFLWVIPNIYFIKYVTKDLEEGRRNDFITDTLGVFLERSFAVANEVISFTLSSILIVGVSVFFIRKRKAIAYGWNSLFALFLIMIGLIHFFYFFLNTPYPYGRTAIGFWVLFLVLISYVLIGLLKTLKPFLQTAFVLILFGLNTVYLLKTVDAKVTVEWYKQQGMKEWVNDLKQQHPDDIRDISVAMSIDHYGVYDNYYHYLQPNDLPSKILVYDRKGYDRIPDSIRHLFAHQDAFLLYGNYEPFFDAIIPKTGRRLIKRYPEMQTDWWMMNP